MKVSSNQIPPGFARHPAGSAFWVLCAPIVFPVIAITLFGPLFSILLQQPPQSLAVGWLTLCFAGALQFWLLTLWSRSIIGGTLTGQAPVSMVWLIRAIWIGPLCLLIPSIGIAQLFPEQTGWQFADDVDPEVFEPENWALGFIVYAVIVAPILEEITFRGVALSALRERGIPIGFSIFLSSAAFAAIHLQYSVAALSVVFLAGVGFCLLRIASGSMLVAIVAHSAANATMLALQTG